MIEGRRAILRRILMAGGAAGVGVASTRRNGPLGRRFLLSDGPVEVGPIYQIAAERYVAAGLDAKDITYTLPSPPFPAGAGVVRTQDLKNAEFVSVMDFGVKGDGRTDDTDKLQVAFSIGGDIYVPEGNYLIKGRGPDTGGVAVNIKRSTRVHCHPNARFFTNETDGLDNDMIRFTVPSNGRDIPPEGIILEWYGGMFDQRNQKVSIEDVPFRDQYLPPPGKAGRSATCDGLSIRGSYNDATVSGIKRCVVSGVTTLGGDHWQNAGGDTGIFVGGCEEQYVANCRTIGNRDVGVYTSAADSTSGKVVLRCRTIIENNLHVNCFVGASIKRSAGYGQIRGNHAENCPRGFSVELVKGEGSVGTEITGNTGNRCGIPIRLQKCEGFSVHDNLFTDLGAVLADGTTVERHAGCKGLITMGCLRGSVRRNAVMGLTSGAAMAYPSARTLIDCTNLGTDKSSFVMWIGNVGDGLSSVGHDTGENNSFIENIVYNPSTSPNMFALGTNAYEVRLGSTGSPIYRNPLLFGDGSPVAPIIASESQNDTGLYFGTKLVGVSVAGTGRIAANDLGVAFNGVSPIARPSYKAPAGTASRAGFDTGTVTLPLLAGHVKALIEDLQVRGDFGKS